MVTRATVAALKSLLDQFAAATGLTINYNKNKTVSFFNHIGDSTSVDASFLLSKHRPCNVPTDNAPSLQSSLSFRSIIFFFIHCGCSKRAMDPRRANIERKRCQDQQLLLCHSPNRARARKEPSVLRIQATAAATWTSVADKREEMVAKPALNA